MRPALAAFLGIGFLAHAADFQLIGHVRPKRSVVVYLQGATAPFAAETETDVSGRFRFRKLRAGTYVLMVRGLQRTVEVGPSLADPKGRVTVTVDLTGSSAQSRARVSVRELAVPQAARGEYREAEKALGRRDVDGAIAHLQHAVELAPGFSAAWNHLGTLAYQSGKYAESEANFRKSLDADPDSYAPLLNLGGVLLNRGKWDEALACNLRAVARNPNDALANAQLGMAYFHEGELDPAEKYLTLAKGIDPSHYSHPQLILAEIHLRRRERQAAAEELQDLLARHPDLPNAATLREEIARLLLGK